MLNHEQKLKLARRLRNDEEARKRTHIFQTKAWDKHREANENKGKRKTSSIWRRVEVPQQIKISWFKKIIKWIKQLLKK